MKCQTLVVYILNQTVCRLVGHTEFGVGNTYIQTRLVFEYFVLQD